MSDIPPFEYYSDTSWLEQLKQMRDDRMFGIDFNVSRENLSDDNARLLGRLLTFAERVKGDISDKVRSSGFSDRIMEFVEKSKLDTPSFIVLDSVKAKSFLEENELPLEIELQNSYLLIFKLPKPLDQFWWKGGASSGNSGVNVDGVVNEWGKIYREVLPIVWREKNRFEQKRELHFTRINESGQHKKGEYYYVWKVEKGESNMFDLNEVEFLDISDEG